MNALPEILQGLMSLLKEHGRDMDGADEAWANPSKWIVTEGLCSSGEGDDENGPYRIEIMARATEDRVGHDEPLLKLETGPGVLWFNEVKRLAAESMKPEPMPVH